MKDPGKILYPEQYLPAGNEVMISNSSEALTFFEDYYPEGGIVLLGTLRLKSFNLPSLLVWMYFDIQDKNEPKLLSTIPVFKVDMQYLNNIEILNIIPHEEEVFSYWKETLYTSVFTTKGEIVVMRARGLFNESDATQVLELVYNDKVSMIYPAELYSHSAHKFIGVCWSVVMESDLDKIIWFPVLFEDQETMSSYSTDDLTDHPIEIGETANVGGTTFKLSYKEKYGSIFSKLENPQKPHILKLDLSKCLSHNKESKA